MLFSKDSRRVFVTCPLLAALVIFGFTFERGRNLVQHVFITFYRTVMFVALVCTAFRSAFTTYITYDGNKHAIGYDILITCNLIHAIVAYVTLWRHEHVFVDVIDDVRRDLKRHVTYEKRQQIRVTLQRYNVTVGVTSFTFIATALFAGSYITDPDDSDLSAIFPYYVIWLVFNVLVMLLEYHVCRLLDASFRSAAEARLDPERFIESHKQTLEQVKMADVLFSNVIFTWSGATLLSICCCVYSVKNTPLRHEYVAVLVLLTLNVIHFVLAVFHAAAVNNKVNEVAEHFQDAVDVIDKAYEFDDDFYYRIKMTALYAARMTISRQGLTTLGLFVVDTDLVIMIASTALTYSIIVYDLG